jgi:hypothetical protein
MASPPSMAIPKLEYRKPTPRTDLVDFSLGWCIDFGFRIASFGVPRAPWR